MIPRLTASFYGRASHPSPQTRSHSVAVPFPSDGASPLTATCVADGFMKCGRRSEMTDRALFVAEIELIEVVAARLEVVHLDVDRMGEVGRRDRGTTRDAS